MCGIIIGLLGLLKLYKAFMPQLPGCTTDATATVIRDIFYSITLQGSNFQVLIDKVDAKAR